MGIKFLEAVAVQIAVIPAQDHVKTETVTNADGSVVQIESKTSTIPAAIGRRST